LYIHYTSSGRRSRSNLCEPYKHHARIQVLISQLQNYLEVRNHCQEFRRVVRDSAGSLTGAAQDDIMSKQLQVVKLELEASLKLQKYDDLEGLFEQCWNCKSADRYDTLADLILVIHADLVKSGVQASSQSSTQRAPDSVEFMLTLTRGLGNITENHQCDVSRERKQCHKTVMLAPLPLQFDSVT